MKKLLIIALALATITGAYAQQTSKEAKKAAKQAEKEARRAAQNAEKMVEYNQAKGALEARDFVLEANQLVFKRGQTSYVNPNTNFIALKGGRASIQIAPNNAVAGANGLGGVTVEGNASSIKYNVDSKGNLTFSMMVIGRGVSAKVELSIPYGSAVCSADVIPNFNTQTMSFNGTLLPTSESNVFKGLSW